MSGCERFHSVSVLRCGFVGCVDMCSCSFYKQTHKHPDSPSELKAIKMYNIRDAFKYFTFGCDTVTSEEEQLTEPTPRSYTLCPSALCWACQEVT